MPTMHTLNAATIIPNLIIGPIAVIGGILIVRFRKTLRDWVVSSEKNALGEERGNTLGLLQTPFWAGVTGVMIASIGLTMIGFGLVALVQHLGGA